MGRIETTLPALMGQHRIKQTELAAASGIRYATLNHLYNGKTERVDFGTLAAILDGLHALTGQQYSVADLLEYHPAAVNEVSETALLDASAIDLGQQLADLEAETPPQELADWLAALAGQSSA